MPAQPWVEPNPESYDGRGWEPDRTYHTPRRGARSSKSACSRCIPPSELAKPEWCVHPGVSSSNQGGMGGHFTPQPANRRPPPQIFPRNNGWGERESAQLGFHPELRPLHRTAGVTNLDDKTMPRQRDYVQKPPIMLNGAVKVGGRVVDKNLHHCADYVSPDRALVGAEEAAARASAEKMRLHRRPASPPSSGARAALHARQRALAAAESRRTVIPSVASGKITNKTHGSHEPPSARVATPVTMSRGAGY